MTSSQILGYAPHGRWPHLDVCWVVLNIWSFFVFVLSKYLNCRILRRANPFHRLGMTTPRYLEVNFIFCLFHSRQQQIAKRIIEIISFPLRLTQLQTDRHWQWPFAWPAHSSALTVHCWPFRRFLGMHLVIISSISAANTWNVNDFIKFVLFYGVIRLRNCVQSCPDECLFDMYSSPSVYHMQVLCHLKAFASQILVLYQSHSLRDHCRLDSVGSSRSANAVCSGKDCLLKPCYCINIFN